jgi:hypothetical protein
MDRTLKCSVRNRMGEQSRNREVEESGACSGEGDAKARKELRH